jgi:hypothetical protein
MWNTTLNRMIKKAKRCLNLFVWKAGGSQGLPAAMIRIWNAYCRPLLEYGAELWQGEISDDVTAGLEQIQTSFLKAALGLSGTIATAGLAELPVATLASRRHTLKLLFWNKLCAAGTTRLLSRVFRHRHAQVVAGAHLSVPYDGLPPKLWVWL